MKLCKWYMQLLQFYHGIKISILILSLNYRRSDSLWSHEKKSILGPGLQIQTINWLNASGFCHFASWRQRGISICAGRHKRHKYMISRVTIIFQKNMWFWQSLYVPYNINQQVLFMLLPFSLYTYQLMLAIIQESAGGKLIGIFLSTFQQIAKIVTLGQLSDHLINYSRFTWQGISLNLITF